jgi:hypothetical protein
MADKTENILVDFDYNNIVIVDPNKVITEDGTVKERYVKQEDLVMYVNLECQVYPRTKLALGVGITDSIQNISIASINFMNPGQKVYMDNTYTDELTGRDTLKGKGQNQPNRTTTTEVSDGVATKYMKQEINNVTDNGLLGITRISIRQGLDFMPTFDITLEDVKGRALFESGNQSPYAAFFNMPYPMFELTLKGFYGKGVKYRLLLRSFNARFDSGTSNFTVDVKFHTYQFGCLSEVSMGYLLAVPYMYQSRYSVKSKLGTPSNISNIENVNAYRGYEKVKEIYSEYKTKGLIPENFPNLTIGTLKNNIENFIKNILDSFTKQNLNSLTNIEQYFKDIDGFRKDIYDAQTVSWKDTYMDTNNYLILKKSGLGSFKSIIPAKLESKLNDYNVLKGGNDEVTLVYTFKKEIKSQSVRESGKVDLNKKVQFWVNKLINNETLGASGSYTVNNKVTSSSIPVDIKPETFRISFEETDVDWDAMYIKTKNVKQTPSDAERELFKQEVIKSGAYKSELNADYVLKDGKKEIVNQYFVFEGNKRFIQKLDEIEERAKNYRKEIEDKLTDALFKTLESSDNGIGFKPTIRNVLAVIFANGEAFLRLLEDVHKNAWDVREHKDRKKAIFESSVSSANPDNITSGVNENVPVYPWPTFLITTTGEDGHEMFEPKYPGDEKVIKFTKAYNSTIWPEVEFVEEFTKAFTQRGKLEEPKEPAFNEVVDVKRISLNPIEFPIDNTVFQSKEEVKYFYELFERLVFLSSTSRLNRFGSTVATRDIVANIIAESEIINIKESLSNDNPFLMKKLVDYAFSSNNFVNVLRHISNQGVGISWQNYIRGIYNTPYIKELDSNSQFLFLDEIVMANPISRPIVSLKQEDIFIETLSGDSETNSFDLLDVYPYLDLRWVKNQLPDGKKISKIKDVLNTQKTISFDKKIKTLTNFSLNDSLKPVTNFVYYGGNITPPTPELYAGGALDVFYDRPPDTQLITEGNLDYVNYSGYVTANQTISMLNTPYFANAIQEGVKKFRDFDKHPFVSAAYLFINSLPLTTLKEKYKTYDGGFTNDLDYIFITLKKFGGIHKLPYPFLVKIGSIWHRYKKFVNEGVDIIDGVWKDFNYLTNFDPVTSAKTKNYTLTVDGGVVDIILEKNSKYGNETSTLINTGFYPKLINDFNVFYQGFEVFSGYTNGDIQSGIDNLGVKLKYVPEALIVGEKGFDVNDLERDLKVIPWSVYVETPDTKFMYPFPSMGTVINQTYDECFSDFEMKIELTGNTSMYNGSVRSFWSLPTYGYFDNSRVLQNSPRQYLKELLYGTPDTSEEKKIQPNFSIKGDVSKYSQIEELFSTFETDILDLFEEKFLNFSKSMYDIDESIDYGLNFQKLMVDMMKLPIYTEPTSTSLIATIQGNQLSTINGFLSKFIDTTQYIKYGNPGNYNKKLFLTFSNYDIVEPYVWSKYQVVTPNALPTNGGTVTLSTSKTNFPNEWKTLETYIGYSTIDKLVYSNNGSFITDFFVDLNVAFTVDNIKTYSPIIKIYASQKLKDYVDKAVLPTNEPNINSNAVLTDGNIIELIPANNISVVPVLFNESKEILYTGSKSVLFGKNREKSLFDDVILSYYGPFGLQDNPIVTTYIRPRKLKTEVPFKSNYNLINLKQMMDTYIDNLSKFQDKALNNLFIRLQLVLPTVTNVPEQMTGEVIKADLGKLEYWECFKAINDKWIAGYEFNNKTLFEDVLMLDRASRNIGDKILVDIYKLKDRLNTLYNDGPTVDMQSFVESILIENNFVVMNLPSYVNFYNVSEVSKNAKPKLEGTLEFANNLFGTFLNVDVRQSSAKMICTYAGSPSQYVDVRSTDFKFKDDAFDIRRPAGNPLVENQTTKDDYDKSNRVVGFNVDIGPQNQSIFSNFSVSQETGTATAESLEVENMMANMSSGKNAATQTISLYNIYKNRSYTCEISMMGNALIQPTMYFNLRHVPMFHGPYMITQVNHSIGPGVFDTVIQGIRQPTASILKIDNYIQSLKTSLLQTLKDQQKQSTATNETKPKTTTTQNEQTKINEKASGKQQIDENDNCRGLLPSDYSSFTPVDSPEEKSVNVKDAVTKILSRMANSNITDDGKLKYAIFASMYLISNYSDGKTVVLKGFENNFTGIELNNKYPNYKGKTYYCAVSRVFFNPNNNNKTTSIPQAVFSSIDENIDFLIARYNPRMVNVKTNISLADGITKFWILNNGSEILPEDVYIGMPSKDIENIRVKVEASINLFNNSSGVVTPPVAKLNPLVDKYVYSIANPPIFESLTITVDPKIDGPRQIFSIKFDYDIDAICAAGRGTGQQFNSNLISNSKQQVNIEIQDLLNEMECSNVPAKEFRGSYKFKITIYTTPVKADGTPDNTRTDFYKSYPITFIL